MNNLQDWKRIIDTQLNDAGFTGYVLETKLDGENKVFAEITIDGRTASGLPDLVLGAIEEAKQYNISLTDAFRSRNMYAPPI